MARDSRREDPLPGDGGQQEQRLPLTPALLAGLAPAVAAALAWRGLGGRALGEPVRGTAAERPTLWLLDRAGEWLGGGPGADQLWAAVLLAAGAIALARLAQGLGLGSFGALAAGLLFAWHPLHLEGWLGAHGRGELAALSGSLLALERIAAALRGARFAPFAAAGWALLAVGAAGSAWALLPMGAALVHLWPHRAGGGLRAWRVLLPAGVVLVVGLLLFGAGSGEVGYLPSLPRRLLGILELLGSAWLLAVWPSDLSVARPYPLTASVASPAVLLGAAALSAAAFVGFRGQRGALQAGLTLAVAGLLPLAARSLAPLGSQGLGHLTDPAAAWALPGLVLLLLGWLARLGRFGPAAGALAAIGLLVPLAARAPAWEHEEALWRAEVARGGPSAYPLWNLGREELERYRRSRDPAHLAAAFERFSLAQDRVELAADGRSTIFVGRADVLRSNLGVAWSLLFEAEIDAFQDFETPATIFEQLTQAYPSFAEPWIGLGITRARVRRFDEAEQALRRAIEVDPGRPEPHLELAKVLFLAGRYADARGHAEFALERRPGGREERLWAARANLESGHRGRARALASELASRAGGDGEAEIVLGAAAFAERDLATSLQHFERALSIDPEHAFAHARRAKTLLLLGEEEEALRALLRACELGPELFEPHYDLAALLLSRGQQGLARPYLERAYLLGRDPGLLARLRGELDLILDDGATALALSRVDAQRGDPGAALHWARRALAEDADDPAALGAAARALDELGRGEEAVDYLERAVAGVPEALQPRLELARLLARLERRAEARREFERLLEGIRFTEGDGERARAARALEQVLREELQELDD
jgi:Flp pilus assembly protein TadD